MIRDIYTYNDDVLRQKSIDIEKEEDLSDLINDMKETMLNAKGAGLSAPQIGINKKLIVIREKIGEEVFEGTFINPKILSYSDETDEQEEGCLSLPSISAIVKRPTKILLNWYDENWEQHEEEFIGMKARIIQHEIDHLEGTLYTDRIDLAERVKLFMDMENIKNKKIAVSYPIKI